MKTATAHDREKQSLSKLALSTWIRMLKFHNLVMREARVGLSERCTMPQFDVIAQLSREKNGTPLVELSRHLLVTAGNVTGIIDRMESDGLVKRSRDRKDRRVTRVHLTEKGKKLAKAVIPLHVNDIHRMFSGLNEEEIIQLRRLIDKLVFGLGEAPLVGARKRRG